MSKKMKIIIDCDPGFDDMQAILMALASKHVVIVAITTGFGNVSAEQTYLNTKKILYTCNRTDIPVYRSNKQNFTGFKPTSNQYHGTDGLCDLSLQYDEYMDSEPTMNSPEALVHFVNQYPGEIHLVAISPLTNLKSAYLLDNLFPEKLASLNVMGGDRNETSKDNVTLYAEFNCWYDPAAWRFVMTNFKLANNKKINLINLDLCQKTILKIPFLESYFNNSYADDPMNKRSFLIKQCYKFMSSKWNGCDQYTCDPLALFVAIYPENKYAGKLCFIDNVHLEGEKVGHVDFRYDDSGSILLIDTVDIDLFCRALLESIHP